MTHPITIQLPAGEYYVGDPCYVIPDAEWSGFCDVLFGSATSTVTQFKATAMLAGGTAFGDGCYEDQFGNRYGVDAGLLAVVPRSLWDPALTNDQVLRLGNIVTFNGPFAASCHNGDFQFGHIMIDTNGDDEDDVDYSDDDEDN